MARAVSPLLLVISLVLSLPGNLKKSHFINTLFNEDGPTEEQAAQLVGAIKSRCPIYTTLERSAPIEMEVSLASKQ